MEVEQTALDNAKQIAALWESSKSAHKRIDENDRITSGIHELAKNVALIASEIKILTQKQNENSARIEAGQKAQGERIGRIEQAMAALSHNEKAIEDHEKRLDAIEKEPGKKWNKLTWGILMGAVGTVVTAIVAGVIALFKN